MKARAFHFHYNKPESAKQKRNVLTVHQSGICHLVHHLIVNVPVRTRNRKTQPRCVVAGKGVLTLYESEDGVTAVIDPQ